MGPYVDQSGFEISSYACEGVQRDIVVKLNFTWYIYIHTGCS